MAEQKKEGISAEDALKRLGDELEGKQQKRREDLKRRNAERLERKPRRRG